MKVSLSGMVVEVGNITADDGDELGSGMCVEADGVPGMVFIPMAVADCREAGKMLFRQVTINIDVEAA